MIEIKWKKMLKKTLKKTIIVGYCIALVSLIAVTEGFEMFHELLDSFVNGIGGYGVILANLPNDIIAIELYVCGAMSIVAVTYIVTKI